MPPAPAFNGISPRRNSSSFQSAAVSRYDRTFRLGLLGVVRVFFRRFAKNKFCFIVFFLFIRRHGQHTHTLILGRGGATHNKPKKQKNSILKFLTRQYQKTHTHTHKRPVYRNLKIQILFRPFFSENFTIDRFAIRNRSTNNFESINLPLITFINSRKKSETKRFANFRDKSEELKLILSSPPQEEENKCWFRVWVYLCVCMCVCLCVASQSSNPWYTPVWIRFFLNLARRHFPAHRAETFFLFEYTKKDIAAIPSPQNYY